MYKPLTADSIFKSLVASILGLLPIGTSAVEVQNHGLWFEHWLCDTFFDGYRPPRYTQKWDIPAQINTRHGQLPVNPKASKLGSPIGLGDALRQFDIAQGREKFILIVGFWEQTNATTKTWANVQTVTVTPEQWRQLWHPITRRDLERLDAVIKDTTLTLEETRLRAQAIKSKPPFTDSIISLNPKIDQSQRRLQCSLRFHAFFDHLLPQASRTRQETPSVWSIPVPEVPNASARTFKE